MDTSEDPSSAKRKSRLVLGILWTGRKVGSLFLWSVRRVRLAFSWSVRNVGLGWTVFFVCVFLIIVLGIVNSPPPPESGTSTDSGSKSNSKPRPPTLNDPCPPGSSAFLTSETMGVATIDQLRDLTHQFIVDMKNGSIEHPLEYYLSKNGQEISRSTQVKIIDGSDWTDSGERFVGCRVEVEETGQPEYWIVASSLSTWTKEWSRATAYLPSQQEISKINRSVDQFSVKTSCPSGSMSVIKSKVPATYHFKSQLALYNLRKDPDAEADLLLSDLNEHEAVVLPQSTEIQILSGQVRDSFPLCSVKVVNSLGSGLDGEVLWLAPGTFEIGTPQLSVQSDNGSDSGTAVSRSSPNVPTPDSQSTPKPNYAEAQKIYSEPGYLREESSCPAWSSVVLNEDAQAFPASGNFPSYTPNPKVFPKGTEVEVMGSSSALDTPTGTWGVCEIELLTAGHERYWIRGSALSSGGNN